MKHLTISFATVALLACSSAPKPAVEPVPGDDTTAGDTTDSAETTEAEPAGTPDSQLGLSKSSVFDVPDPAVFTYTTADPGGNARQARAYYISPPVIPHQISDYLPITMQENDCLDCHEPGEASPGDPTPLPPSHTTDLRNAPKKVGDAAVGARYRCIACHMPKSDAPPLVGNDFGR